MARSTCSAPRALCLTALAAAATLGSATARAQTAGCDSAEHRRGRELRDQHQDQAAYELFRGLFEREHSGCAQARMGLALRALGRWRESEEALNGALQRQGDAWIVQSRDALTTQLQEVRQHLGELVVDVAPAVPGAVLWVNGERAADLPMAGPVRVSTGSTVIEVRAPGYVTMRRTVEIQGGGRVREAVTLVAGVASGGVSVGGGGAGPATPPGGGGGGAMQALGIVGLVAGGAFVLGGGALWAVAEGRYSQYTGASMCRSDTESPEELCPGLRADATTFRRVGVVGLGVGAALVVTGVVLMVTAPRGGGERRAAVGCAPQIDAPGIVCGARF